MNNILKWLAVEFKYVGELKENIAHAKEHLINLKKVESEIQGVLNRQEKDGTFRTEEQFLLRKMKNDISNACEKLRFASQAEYQSNHYGHDLREEFTTLAVPLQYQEDFNIAQEKLIEELSSHTGELQRVFINLKSAFILLDRHIKRKTEIHRIEILLNDLMKFISEFEEVTNDAEQWISSLTATVEKIEKKRVA
ncbi:hypothetical protein HQ489_00415 [Candidatus Woesearchaeota archaeon]|nr:hypothetical protein [Candidatus Woesearchaeota archaeon]